MTPSTDSAAPRWVRVRVARPAANLARSTVFYRALLGLPASGGFRDHDGYDGVFFTLPGGGELELTAGPAVPTGGTDEDLLVLYLGSAAEMGDAVDRLVAAGVVPADRPTRTGTESGRPGTDEINARDLMCAGVPSRRDHV